MAYQDNCEPWLVMFSRTRFFLFVFNFLSNQIANDTRTIVTAVTKDLIVSYVPNSTTLQGAWDSLGSWDTKPAYSKALQYCQILDTTTATIV